MKIEAVSAGHTKFEKSKGDIGEVMLDVYEQI